MTPRRKGWRYPRKHAAKVLSAMSTITAEAWSYSGDNYVIVEIRNSGLHVATCEVSLSLTKQRTDHPKGRKGAA